MSTIDILKEAEADLSALATLPGEIRARVKAGVAELTRLRDAIDGAIAGLTASAGATLQSLQGLAAAAEGPAPIPAAPAGDAPAPDAAQAAVQGAAQA